MKKPLIAICFATLIIALFFGFIIYSEKEINNFSSQIIDLNSKIKELEKENKDLKAQITEPNNKLADSKTETKETNPTPKTENTPTKKSTETKDTIPDNAISLYYGGDDILCGTTKENIDALIKCLVAKDEVGWNQMFAFGQAFTVPSKTKAIILERKLTVTKVRICEGTYKDEIAWVVMEATK